MVAARRTGGIDPQKWTGGASACAVTNRLAMGDRRQLLCEAKVKQPTGVMRQFSKKFSSMSGALLTVAVMGASFPAKI